MRTSVWLIAVIVLVTIASCGSKSGQKLTESKQKPGMWKARVQEMRLANDSTYISMPGITLMMVDTAFRKGDTIIRNDMVFRIIP
jgi:hypothetical protein